MEEKLTLKEVTEKYNISATGLRNKLTKANIEPEKIGKCKYLTLEQIKELGLSLRNSDSEDSVVKDTFHVSTLYTLTIEDDDTQLINVCNHLYEERRETLQEFILAIYPTFKNSTIKVFIESINQFKNYLKATCEALDLQFDFTRGSRTISKLFVKRPQKNIVFRDFTRFVGLSMIDLTKVYDVNPNDSLAKQMMYIRQEIKTNDPDSINKLAYTALMEETLGDAKLAKRRLPKAVDYADTLQLGLRHYYQIINDSRKGGLLYYNEKYLDKLVHNVYQVDINSSYPNVMRNGLMPVGRAHDFTGSPFEIKALDNPDITWFIVKVSLSNLRVKANKFPWISYSRINYVEHRNGMIEEVSAMENGSQVTRTTNGMKLFTTMTRQELELLEECYTFDIEYVSGLWFYAKQGLFKNFVDKYYEIKKNASNVTERTNAKLFLNLGYGMLSVSIFEKCRSDHSGNIDWNKSKYNYYKETYSPAGIAILYEARCNLIRSLLQQNVDDILYTDTDCMVLKSEPKGISIDNTELGSWKIEHTNVDFKVLGYKTYMIDSELTIAGLPDEIKDSLTVKDFYRGSKVQSYRTYSDINGLHKEFFDFEIGNSCLHLSGDLYYNNYRKFQALQKSILNYKPKVKETR